jgi:hypothetical protein
MGLHLFIKASAFIRQRDRSGGAIEEPHSQALLEPTHSPADTGVGDAADFGRFDEASALDDRS